MIITEESELGMNTILFNRITGVKYQRIKSFNTENKEAEVYISLQEKRSTNKELELIKPHLLPIIQPDKINIPINKVAIFDRNHNGGQIIQISREDESKNSKNELAVGLVTLRHAIAIDRRTGEIIQ